jgi:aspartate kinase
MLHANEYVVYTDVDGIYTTDPRICPEAKIIYKMDYNIVQELSAMGAKVMHPSSILPCMEKNIPIIIKNTFSDNNLNTIITKVNKQETKISAIALQKDVKLIKITSESMWNNYGFVFDIFRRFSERRIDVNIISTSQFTISTTCDEKNMVLIQDLIQDLEEKYIVEMIPKCAIVSLVTNNIPEIYKFLDFSEINHHLISIGATNNSISFVVDEDNSTDIVNSIHKYI